MLITASQNPELTSEVLFCPKHKDIQFTVIEDFKKNRKYSHLRSRNQRIWTFFSKKKKKNLKTVNSISKYLLINLIVDK